ncbi:MAG: bifunctional demethylmenaquinone methyltransferase/2-methoxy-6-polyprenyl-1,4-benzoquinol methylase UbiE [Planctomycetes bacterium]|nr:bifunctional demethylmenaquinone methyltransferase/2-methoxy-6-polyprenyl-1,4-benzoquinol methylase UbiE [Planctomycetota bacterium]MCB9891831.1 bifunctional demethylmenaquinone methyltransferase/2-methoxy-6-polyprenyl-1,4-benzoquinol methylase UbiE [Planctomycetota bacterium]MCB9918687.1 bifunctional demethylmenaquinone methyltransferase/2-methoxy-6-polyprenyl-1,4-benzoquinol methylase UbiE [Planctomycetota bacterium]
MRSSRRLRRSAASPTRLCSRRSSVLPYAESVTEKPRFDEVGPNANAVRAMFADVAPRYDRMNRTLSAGVDVLWRRHTVRRVLAGQNRRLRVLDVCSGTGDLALALARAGCDVVGTDFCAEMLERAMTKRREATNDVRFLAADTQRLPFDDGEFDVATVAFGIRNVHDPRVGLADMRRVVKPGGRVFVLEFSKPKTRLVGPAYLWYFRKVLPRLGRILAPATRRHEAYDYLPESVLRFPEREEFVRLMQDAGLEDARFEPLTFGIASLYEGRKPIG